MASYVPAWMGPRVAVGGRIYPLLTAYLIPGIKKKKNTFLILQVIHVWCKKLRKIELYKENF